MISTSEIIENAYHSIKKIENDVRVGKQFEKACEEENMTPFVYKRLNQIIKNLDVNEVISNSKISGLVLETIIRYNRLNNERSFNNERTFTPERIFVPISESYYLYLEIIAKNRGMSISQLAANLLSEKIEQFMSNDPLMKERSNLEQSIIKRYNMDSDNKSILF